MVEIVKNAQGNAKKWMEMLEENLEQNRSLQYFLNHSMVRTLHFHGNVEVLRRNAKNTSKMMENA